MNYRYNYVRDFFHLPAPYYSRLFELSYRNEIMRLFREYIYLYTYTIICRLYKHLFCFYDTNSFHFHRAGNIYQDSQVKTNIVLFHDGEIEFITKEMTTSSCDIDIEWYPFDRQTCKLSFTSWTYDSSRVRDI